MREKKQTRREFLEELAVISGSIVFLPTLLSSQEAKVNSKNALATPSAGLPDLVEATGGKAGLNVRAAIDGIGGMKRFVKKNDVVVVKPNIGWDRIAVQAANTNPEVVAEIVRMSLESGAKEVKVFDHSFSNPGACYKRSGIEDAAKEAGAKVKYVDQRLFKTMKFPGTEFIKEWPVYMEAMEADCLINVPVAKHHNSAKLTMAIKNLMGIIGGNRGKYHQEIHLALAELASRIKPNLTVLDAYRIIVRNGPTGGSLRDVETPQKCIAGTNQVSVDAYGATLFNLSPKEVGYLKIANEMGLGEIDISRLKISKVST